MNHDVQYVQIKEHLDCLKAKDQEIAKLQAEVIHWKANHDNMRDKAAFLSQRPDLPVDRIPVYEMFVQRIAILEAQNVKSFFKWIFRIVAGLCAVALYVSLYLWMLRP